MHERQVAVPTADGNMRTFLARPEGEGRFPVVVLYMDIWGVREELFEIARGVATAGYCVAVPDLFHREGDVRWTYIDAANRRISFTRLPPEEQERVLGPLSRLTDAMVVSDTKALIEYFEQSGGPVDTSKMGCFGYCMGGRHVLRVASTFPERFLATACLHGTTLVNDTPESPHRQAARLHGELYCGFGELDPDGSAEVVAAFNESMRSAGAKYRYARHPGANHGYALPDRDVHDEKATNNDWEAIHAMFRRQLSGR